MAFFMSFDKKIKQFKFIEKNLDKFMGESALRNSNLLEDAITQDQLFEKGEDGLGRSLGEYSNFTKNFKTTIAGQLGRSTRIKNITLRDTGDFHKSVKVKLTRQGILIDSQPQKEDTNLIDEFGEEILFVNDDNLNNFIRPHLLDDLKKDIRKAL